MKRLIVLISTVLLLVIGGYAVYAMNQPEQETPKPVAIKPLPKLTGPPANKYNQGPVDATELLELVNEARKDAGVKPLKVHTLLNQSAQFKADDMAKKNYFSHYGKGTTRNNGLDYLDSLHPPCSNISENIVDLGDYGNSELAMGSWMGSTPHRKAILNPDYTYTGFGISGGKVVEHFCIAN